MRPRKALMRALALGGALVFLLSASQGQEAPVARWRASAGLFAPFDIPSGVDASAGWTVAVEILYASSPQTRRAAAGSFRFAHYPLGAGQSVDIFVPTLELRQYFGASRDDDPLKGWWIGIGPGMLFGKNSGGGSVWHFAYTAALGYDADRLFVEARVLRGVKPGEHGFIASIGLRW